MPNITNDNNTVIYDFNGDVWKMYTVRFPDYLMSESGQFAIEEVGSLREYSKSDIWWSILLKRGGFLPSNKLFSLNLVIEKVLE